MKKKISWKQRSESYFDSSLSLLDRLLHARGFWTEEEKQSFLVPTLDDLHDPFLLNDMDKAVSRIRAALENHERVCIYGDYDVDGITSAAVVYNFLESLGADLIFMIPDRENDGYGLSIEAAGQIAEAGVSLVITVDCGTSSFEEVDFLNDKKIDVIITDHHECRSELPKALSVINPARHDSLYPFRYLSGVGVAFKLICALCREFDIAGKELDHLDLTALGTVADVVKMEDENRILVYFGLKKINEKPGVGIKSLLKAAGIQPGNVDEDTLGYMLAPRINSAGRLEDPKTALMLLLTDDGKEAEAIAEKLCELNRMRQNMQMKIHQEIEEMLKSDDKYSCSNVLIIPGRNWKSGIIGIVASMVVESYGKPTLIISVDEDGIGKGSARSTDGFNLFEALSFAGECLVSYGGHEKAAGFTVMEDMIDTLDEKLNEYSILKGISDTAGIVCYDLVIGDETLDVASVEQINRMAPFGEGNPRPVFLFNGGRVSEMSFCGSEDKHIKMKLNHSHNNIIDCIGFNLANSHGHLGYGAKVDVLGHMQINVWRNRKNVQIQLIDLKEV